MIAIVRVLRTFTVTTRCVVLRETVLPLSLSASRFISFLNFYSQSGIIKGDTQFATRKIIIPYFTILTIGLAITSHDRTEKKSSINFICKVI